MGGCRCSYRDCTARSDGKTHMFHFPVFDKVRCHQWITNAQKTGFLNLKLSQLKNRVICQHHFKDECFMNETKGRLKIDALPTEDGPYCSTKQKDHDEEQILPINVDDIDNDNNVLCLDDKKARMSVKYGDFLTNDVDLVLTNLQNQKVIIDDNNFNKYDANITHNVKNDQYSNQLLIRDALMVNPKDIKPRTLPYKTRSQPTTITEIEKDTNSPSKLTSQTKTPENDVINLLSHKPQPSRDSRIKILSHKKIITPMNIKGELKPVTPSTVIEIPKRKELKNVPAHHNATEIITQVVPIEFQHVNQPENQVNLFKELQINNENIFQSFNLENELQTKIDPPIDQNISQKDSMEYPLFEQQSILTPKHTSQNNAPQLSKIKTLPVNRSILKNKLAPEKQAEIQEKRKFNMKIRDIIDSCLNKIDEDTINADLIKIIAEENQKPTNKNASSNQKSKSPLKNSMAFLEAQLQRMENRLLSKIEQNSRNIIDLKNTLNPTTTKRTLSTQTCASEELHKKQLYKEISKYLSPDANSLIYEELFINQCMEKKTTPALKKRKIR